VPFFSILINSNSPKPQLQPQLCQTSFLFNQSAFVYATKHSTYINLLPHWICSSLRTEIPGKI